MTNKNPYYRKNDIPHDADESAISMFKTIFNYDIVEFKKMVDERVKQSLSLNLIYNNDYDLADVYSEETSFLSYAVLSDCDNDKVDMAKYLLEKGADPDNHLNTWADSPILHAVFSGNLSMVNLLIEYKAKLDLLYNKDGSPLCQAFLHRMRHPDKRFDIVKALVDNGGWIRSELMIHELYTTPDLINEVFNYDAVKFMFDNGYDINAVNNEGMALDGIFKDNADEYDSIVKMKTLKLMHDANKGIHSI